MEIAFPSLKVSLRLEASSLEGLQAAAKGVGPLLVSVDRRTTVQERRRGLRIEAWRLMETRWTRASPQLRNLDVR